MDFAMKMSNVSVWKSKLWYMHLRHIDGKSLKILSERNLPCSYVVERLNVCKCCNLGKRTRVQFSIVVREITQITKPIYLNVRRLSRFPSRRNVKFMLIVVYGYSRKSYMSDLRYRFDAIDNWELWLKIRLETIK